MTKITVFKKDYVTELVKIIRNAKNAQVLQKHLANYHDKDVAEAITRLNETERIRLHYDRHPTACRNFLLSG